MYQKDNVISERGGIAVRDYTVRGHALSLKRRSAMDGIRSGLEKMNFDKVARALGWFSLGLGLLEVLMPKRVQQLVGVRENRKGLMRILDPRRDYSGLIRILGAREITHALLIFTEPRPQQGMWSRVVGDGVDLACLGAALDSRRIKKQRVKLATGLVLGITALDVLTAIQINRKRADEKRYSVLTQADLDSRTRGGAFHVTRSITINRAPDELYRFWHNFENLPQFMYHLKAVRVIDEHRSHWEAKAPAGKRVQWDAEITNDRPNEEIAWQSTSNSDVPNSGRVRFERGPAGRGTVVRVEIEYRPPGGAIGKVVAKLFGEEPGQQVAGDLHRFKQVMETGEVLRSEGSMYGYGQKMQQPARPTVRSNGGWMTRPALEQQREQAKMRD